jgi:hypothetical protein
LNPELQKYQKQYSMTRLIAFAMLVLSPIAFVIVTFFLEPTPQRGEGIQFTLYALLGVAIFSPFLYKIIERVQISNYRKIHHKTMTPAQLFTTLTIIKCAFIEAIFMFGLLLFILTGDRVYMWYFYPIGIAWAVVYWPTEGKFEELVGKATVNHA